ncbi:MAG: MBL fold metallo-hydrolase [Acidimicrobiia bacterium]|nr:MBL fold metallo-hydrolase [Acidimicrobiia bacterium]
MTTRVIVTGTGTPIADPNRAGPGVLITHGETHMQFDTGRATVMRLAATGVMLGDLTAVFLTHQHSDHVVGLTDLLMTRWLEGSGTGGAPLPVYAPSGMAADLAQHILVPWQRELEMRAAHVGYPGKPFAEVHDFEPATKPERIFSDAGVVVEASQVRHEPVVGAVGYRITTPDGIIAISGDTAICDEVKVLAAGADVLVHEVFNKGALAADAVSDVDLIAAYHSEPEAVGRLSAEANVKLLMLTHLIPPPVTADDYADMVSATRAGGFEGELIVCDDLATVAF